MTNEIWHFGIKGQKWGIRRFQNPDGTLTPEGIRRYGTLENFQRQNGIRGETTRPPKNAKVDGPFSNPPPKHAKVDGPYSRSPHSDIVKNLSPGQKRLFDGLHSTDQNRILKKMEKGKDFEQARKEATREAILWGAGLTLASIGIMEASLSPGMRSWIKAYGKDAFRSIKNSNVVQRGSLWLKKMAQRRSMVKNGAVVLKKSAYSVRDIPFGGYLSR